MILAAGLGTRLRPLTDTLPKALLPVAGQPLLVWNLLLLRQHGISEVIINLHHLGHLIEEAIGDGSRFGLRITYSREGTLLGTGGGIKQVEAFFDGAPFLVLNGDTLLELDLTALLRFHLQRARHGAILATLVLREDPEAERWGLVETNDVQEVLRINGRGRKDPTERRQDAAWRRMFAGVHILDPAVLRDVPAGRASSIIEAYVTELAKGGVILGYDTRGYWSDVGTPERYEQAQRDAEAGRVQLADRAKGILSARRNSA